MIETVNRSEYFRDRAWNLFGRKFGDVPRCLTVTAFALEVHTVEDRETVKRL